MSDLDAALLRIDEGLDALRALVGPDADLSEAERAEAEKLARSLGDLIGDVAADVDFRPPDDPSVTALAVRRLRLDSLTARLRAEEPISAQLVNVPAPPPSDLELSRASGGNGTSGRDADDSGGSSNGASRSEVSTLAPARVEASIPEQFITILRAARPKTEASRLSLAARILTFVGMLFALFIVYQFWFTDISESRDQHVLLREFKASLRTQAGLDLSGQSSGGSGVLTTGDPGADATASATAAPPPPSAGEPVAILTIPRLDIEAVVVEGSAATQTMQGPGHVRSTPMPGERGNAAIVGRRTTYGAPFADLDRLRPGDRIIATTPRGAFRYKVAERAFTVNEETDRDPFEPTLGNRLTLVTTAPKFLASERLIVRGELIGDPIPPPALNDRGGSIDDAEDGLSPNWGTIPGFLIWTQMLLLAFGVAYLLYRRWLRWPTYLLTTPVLIALLILTFDSFSKLLPSSM